MEREKKNPQKIFSKGQNISFLNHWPDFGLLVPKGLDETLSKTAR